MRSDPASTRRWLNDIRSQIELVQRFLGDFDYEAFRDDQLRFYAVTRCLEIISEASRRRPEPLLEEIGMSELRRITVDPKQCGGRPCLRGLRIRSDGKSRHRETGQRSSLQQLSAAESVVSV